MKKYSKQQIIKHNRKNCFFCGESEYGLLDAHRILPGEKGGTYHHINVLTLCANCHRKAHLGIIKIDKKYYTSSGKWTVHYFENDQEFWKLED